MNRDSLAVSITAAILRQTPRRFVQRDTIGRPASVSANLCWAQSTATCHLLLCACPGCFDPDLDEWCIRQSKTPFDFRPTVLHSCTNAQTQVRGWLAHCLTHVCHRQIHRCIGHHSTVPNPRVNKACFRPHGLQRCLTLHVSAARLTSNARSEQKLVASC